MRNASPPLSIFLLPVCIARLLSPAGSPKSYDKTETLVLYVQYSLCLLTYKTQQNGDKKIQKTKQKYEDLQVRGEQADGVWMPKPGQLELDMADGGL